MQNPNVVGSGFIAFPPQKPFEKPLIVQPPTVAVSLEGKACFGGLHKRTAHAHVQALDLAGAVQRELVARKLAV